VDARKQRFGPEDLADVFDGANKIIACKGKKSVVFDLKQAEPDADELAKAVLGPSGNLRAPTIKVGKTYLVGFGEEVYADIFG